MGTTTKGFRYPDGTGRVNLGATNMQQLAEDVDAYLSAARARAMAYLAADFTQPSAPYTYAIPLTASASPPLVGFTIGSTSRLIVPTTGIYRVSAQARVTFPAGTAPAVNANAVTGIVARNGSATALLRAEGAPAAAGTYATGTRLLSLTAADYLEWKITTPATATATFKAGEDATFLMAELVLGGAASAAA